MTTPSAPWARWPMTRYGLYAQILLCVAHAGTLATGLAYGVRPSASIQRELDPFWQLAWSAIFVILGPLALIFRLRRAWVYEAIALMGTAGGLIIWGLVSLLSTTGPDGTGGGIQVGIRLLVGAVMLVGFALLELEWVKLRNTVSPAQVNALAAGVHDRIRGGDTNGAT